MRKHGQNFDPFGCGICHKTFKRKIDLRKHEDTDHKEANLHPNSPIPDSPNTTLDTFCQQNNQTSPQALPQILPQTLPQTLPRTLPQPLPQRLPHSIPQLIAQPFLSTPNAATPTSTLQLPRMFPSL